MCRLVMAINWGLAFVSQQGSPVNSEALESPIPGDARALAIFLLYLLIFVLVFLLATYAIIRASPARSVQGDVSPIDESFRH